MPKIPPNIPSTQAPTSKREAFESANMEVKESLGQQSKEKKSFLQTLKNIIMFPKLIKYLVNKIDSAFSGSTSSFMKRKDGKLYDMSNPNIDKAMKEQIRNTYAAADLERLSEEDEAKADKAQRHKETRVEEMIEEKIKAVPARSKNKVSAVAQAIAQVEYKEDIDIERIINKHFDKIKSHDFDFLRKNMSEKNAENLVFFRSFLRAFVAEGAYRATLSGQKKLMGIEYLKGKLGPKKYKQIMNSWVDILPQHIKNCTPYMCSNEVNLDLPQIQQLIAAKYPSPQKLEDMCKEEMAKIATEEQDVKTMLMPKNNITYLKPNKIDIKKLHPRYGDPNICQVVKLLTDPTKKIAEKLKEFKKSQAVAQLAKSDPTFKKCLIGEPQKLFQDAFVQQAGAGTINVKPLYTGDSIDLASGVKLPTNLEKSDKSTVNSKKASPPALAVTNSLFGNPTDEMEKSDSMEKKRRANIDDTSMRGLDTNDEDDGL